MEVGVVAEELGIAATGGGLDHGVHQSGGGHLDLPPLKVCSTAKRSSTRSHREIQSGNDTLDDTLKRVGKAIAEEREDGEVDLLRFNNVELRSSIPKGDEQLVDYEDDNILRLEKETETDADNTFASGEVHVHSTNSHDPYDFVSPTYTMSWIDTLLGSPILPFHI